MMRVAIAGTGGLAYMIAHYIHEETSHHVIFLSRSVKPDLAQAGFQVLVVNYDDNSSLDFALTGIDVVISTVPGTIQIRLIDSAIRRNVRRFAPAEFEGRPSQQPMNALDRGKAAVAAHLAQNAGRIESTAFVCGVLYERFAPGGLHASNIGTGSGISGEGSYMMNLRTMVAEIPLYDARSQQVTLCMTASQDVARFVVRSLDLPAWPTELVMCGERITTHQLANLAANVRGRRFEPNIVWHDTRTLQVELQRSQASGDLYRLYRVLHLVATSEGRYDYTQSNLNSTFGDIKPIRFQEWLTRVWTGQ